jgi:hypothetical protein
MFFELHGPEWQIPGEVIDRGEPVMLLESAWQGDAPTTGWAHALVFTCELESLIHGQRLSFLEGCVDRRRIKFFAGLLEGLLVQHKHGPYA